MKAGLPCVAAALGVALSGCRSLSIEGEAGIEIDMTDYLLGIRFSF